MCVQTKQKLGENIRAEHKAAITSNPLLAQINFHSRDLFKSALHLIVLSLITSDIEESWYTKRSYSRFNEKCVVNAVKVPTLTGEKSSPGLAHLEFKSVYCIS